MCWWEEHICFFQQPPYNLLLMPPHHLSSAAGPLLCRAGRRYTIEWWSKGLAHTAVAPRRERTRSCGHISANGSSLLGVWKFPWLVLTTQL